MLGKPKAGLVIELQRDAAFFEALGDSLVTGPTRTNVNDFRATLVVPNT